MPLGVNRRISASPGLVEGRPLRPASHRVRPVGVVLYMVVQGPLACAGMQSVRIHAGARKHTHTHTHTRTHECTCVETHTHTDTHTHTHTHTHRGTRVYSKVWTQNLLPLSRRQWVPTTSHHPLTTTTHQTTHSVSADSINSRSLGLAQWRHLRRTPSAPGLP